MPEAGEDTVSEYESDLEDSEYAGSRKEGDMIGEYRQRQDRIFKYISIQDKNVRIPAGPNGQENNVPLCLDLDDVLMHVFVSDQNFGFMANPAAKDPEFKFFMEEIGQPCLGYMRRNRAGFLREVRGGHEGGRGGGWTQPTTRIRGVADVLADGRGAGEPGVAAAWTSWILIWARPPSLSGIFFKPILASSFSRVSGALARPFCV